MFFISCICWNFGILGFWDFGILEVLWLVSGICFVFLLSCVFGCFVISFWDLFCVFAVLYFCFLFSLLLYIMSWHVFLCLGFFEFFDFGDFWMLVILEVLWLVSGSCFVFVVVLWFVLFQLFSNMFNKHFQIYSFHFSNHYIERRCYIYNELTFFFSVLCCNFSFFGVSYVRFFGCFVISFWDLFCVFSCFVISLWDLFCVYVLFCD